MQRKHFKFMDRLRVRWSEVDSQHIVFNAHYLTYFDTALAAYWRALAMPYHDTMALLQGDLFMRKATLEYEASARYDDLLAVGLRCARIGTSSIVMAAAVFRGEQRLITGEMVYVFADPATQTSRPVPPALRQLLLGFEAGEPVFDVETGAWDGLQPGARAVREAVFIAEQKIPADLVEDAQDAAAIHAVARNRFGMPLACGRLLAHAPGQVKIGRMATLATVRGAGLGRAVLDALLAAARARGDGTVLLHAQTSAAGFYLRAGFTPSGAEFEEAGIPHLEMRRGL